MAKKWDYSDKCRERLGGIKPNRASDVAYLLGRVDALEEALEEIEKGDGPFSQDPLTHAGNCIENMTSLARTALEAE